MLESRWFLSYILSVARIDLHLCCFCIGVMFVRQFLTILVTFMMFREWISEQARSAMMSTHLSRLCFENVRTIAQLRRARVSQTARIYSL